MTVTRLSTIVGHEHLIIIILGVTRALVITPRFIYISFPLFHRVFCASELIRRRVSER